MKINMKKLMQFAWMEYNTAKNTPFLYDVPFAICLKEAWEIRWKFTD